MKRMLGTQSYDSERVTQSWLRIASRRSSVSCFTTQPHITTKQNPCFLLHIPQRVCAFSYLQRLCYGLFVLSLYTYM